MIAAVLTDQRKADRMNVVVNVVHQSMMIEKVQETKRAVAAIEAEVLMDIHIVQDNFHVVHNLVLLFESHRWWWKYDEMCY